MLSFQMYYNMHCSQFLLQTGRGGDAVRKENGVHRKSNHTASAGGGPHSLERSLREIVSCGDTEQSQVLRGHQERLKGDVSVVDIPRENKT